MSGHTEVLVLEIITGYIVCLAVNVCRPNNGSTKGLTVARAEKRV